MCATLRELCYAAVRDFSWGILLALYNKVIDAHRCMTVHVHASSWLCATLARPYTFEAAIITALLPVTRHCLLS